MEKSFIPEGQIGDWKVEKFEVTEEEAKFNNIRATFSFSDRGRFIKAGEYTRLKRNRVVVMSDTPAELDDFRYFIHQAKGKILLNGLGLGCILQNLLEKQDVTQIIVNEISEEVIQLVGKHFKDKRLTINHADAFTWKLPKGLRFDYVYHDIWDDICADNLPEMKKLHHRYGKWTDNQMSWCREYLE